MGSSSLTPEVLSVMQKNENDMPKKSGPSRVIAAGSLQSRSFAPSR